MMAYAALKTKYPNKKFITHLLNLILKEQANDGYWFEFSYEPEEEKVGYYGAVPTAICILALVEGCKVFKNEKYLLAAIKGCDHLYSTERKGKFLKAKINKHHVLNTNLLCGLALIETANIMNQKSRRKPLYVWATSRAIKRTIESQWLSGAFPYTYAGLGIPFLYHCMTLALLIALHEYFNHPIVYCAIKRGIRFLEKRVIDKEGTVRWEKENFHDKTGAMWIYGWIIFSLNEFSQQNKKIDFSFLLSSIRSLDSFKSAWLLFSLSFVFRSHYSSNKTYIAYKILSNCKLLVYQIKKFKMLFAYLRRKCIFDLDEGAIEEVVF